jgi:hypothetical protein
MANRKSSTNRESGSSDNGADRTRRSAAKVIEQHKRDDNSVGEQEIPFHRPKFHRAYSFGLITLAFFLVSWVGQFIAQVAVESNEARQHGQSFAWSEFWPQFFASTFENWQSEFLQLFWQALGLALFYFWGSSQSKEGDERLEQKIDLLLRDRGIDPAEL